MDKIIRVPVKYNLKAAHIGKLTLLDSFLIFIELQKQLLGVMKYFEYRPSAAHGIFLLIFKSF